MNLRNNNVQIIENGASSSKQILSETRNKGVYCKWNLADLQEALSLIKEKKISGLEASTRFHIPRRTLSRYLSAHLTKKAKLGKKLEGLKINEEKFMRDFDPEHSARETRKMQKKLHSQRTRGGPLYNEKGIHAESGRDMCDCLDLKCPGCFNPCPKCGSVKCGDECRVNRKSSIMERSIEGTDVVIKNPISKIKK